MEDNNTFLNKLTSAVKDKAESLKHYNDLVQSKVDKENSNDIDDKKTSE